MCAYVIFRNAVFFISCFVILQRVRCERKKRPCLETANEHRPPAPPQFNVARFVTSLRAVRKKRPFLPMLRQRCVNIEFGGQRGAFLVLRPFLKMVVFFARTGMDTRILPCMMGRKRLFCNVALGSERVSGRTGGDNAAAKERQEPLT